MTAPNLLKSVQVVQQISLQNENPKVYTRYINQQFASSCPHSNPLSEHNNFVETNDLCLLQTSTHLVETHICRNQLRKMKNMKTQEFSTIYHPAISSPCIHLQYAMQMPRTHALVEAWFFLQNAIHPLRWQMGCVRRCTRKDVCTKAVERPWQHNN